MEETAIRAGPKVPADKDDCKRRPRLIPGAFVFLGGIHRHGWM